MKIIERGSLPDDKVHRCTCINCKTIFEFKQSEAKATYDPREGSYMRIACPVCGREMYKDF